MHIVILSYLKPLAELDRVLNAHRVFLADCYEKGILLMSGPLEPRTGGVLLFRSITKEGLEAVVAKDPFVCEGLVEYRVLSFHPTNYAEAIAPAMEM